MLPEFLETLCEKRRELGEMALWLRFHEWITDPLIQEIQTLPETDSKNITDVLTYISESMKNIHERIPFYIPFVSCEYLGQDSADESVCKKCKHHAGCVVYRTIIELVETASHIANRVLLRKR